MKRFLLMGLTVLLTTPLPAATTTAATDTSNSLHFSTKAGADYAWELTRSGDQWTLSFAPNAIVVDNSKPADAKLQGDYVQLPTMTITGLTDRGGFLTGTLGASQSMQITSHTDSTAVLTASMTSGSMMAVGTNTVAFSQQANDLQVKSFDKSYGLVIPALAGDQGKGLILDLSFSGDAIHGGNLYNVLKSNSGTVRGTLSGQISGIGAAVPEPATLLLLGLGVVLAGRFRPGRSRRS
jgi:hypothetical protein